MSSTGVIAKNSVPLLLLLLTRTVSIKDHRLVTVSQNPVHQVQTHGPSKYHFLEVAPLSNEVFDRVSMAHPDDLLVDNGTIIQLLK